MNKRQLAETFTEIVAMRLDVLDQRINGVWPPRTDLGRWKRRYVGRPDLPAPFVELNTFKAEVDSFVAALLMAVDAADAPLQQNNR